MVPGGQGIHEYADYMPYDPHWERPQSDEDEASCPWGTMLRGERERENSIMETVSARMGVLTGGSLWGLVGSDQFVLQWLRKSYSESNLRSQQWKRERRREGLSEGCRVEAEKGQSLGTNYQDRWGLGQIQCPCWGDERPKPCCLTLVALAGVLVRAA